MRRLSSLILFVLLVAGLSAQKSPHGDSFKTNCDDCHKTDGWKVDLKTIDFEHGRTKFPLVGQHRDVNCRDCHKSLEFAKAPNECNKCHTDIHEQTVGNECGRCHTPASWVVNNIAKLHQQSRFPLIGAHTLADCKDCHKNLIPSSPTAPTASLLRFDPLGIECYDCHKEDYQTASKPNHVEGKYSTACSDCHKINSLSWNGAGINHNFFPLEDGHAGIDCSKCHTSGSYAKIPSECNSCHQPDYASTTNPNHASLGFPTNCSLCHSLSPGWKPADFKDHDASFPIYSGNHKGEWNSCADCHKNPSNYAQFACIDCHEHNKTDSDNEHKGVNGYVYKSDACYACHPTGSGEGGFDHNKSGFPLTGAHTTTACTDCHTSGYTGTPNSCSSCHTNNYNQTTNPNHKANGISNDCATCHTTKPTWKPASYPAHSNLAGAHIPIANDCARCHNGNYTVLQKNCTDCHTPDYNQTTNPNHVTSQFAKTCETCHSQSAWVPSTFNHNNSYPLTGAHATITNCTQCHTNGYTNTPNTCTGCHQANFAQAANPNHTALNISNECAACHTTNPGWEPAAFPTHNNYYVLAGAHIPLPCANCHNGNYTNTANTCAGCHIAEYNLTTNPKHSAAQFPTTCADCHTQSAWSPATFNHDGQYFPIYSGKHKEEWNSCSECHTNGSNYAVFTCTGSCHTQTNMNNEHQGVGGYQYVSSACLACHPNGNAEGSFNHNTSPFPLTGGHAGAECSGCHTNGYSGTSTVCSSCHIPDYNQSTNPNHLAIGLSNECSTCHTTQPGWEPATFPTHNNFYTLAGAHVPIADNCAACHNGNYINSPNTCFGCHAVDYNQTSNPNHVNSNLGTTCEVCHSQSAWVPATFNHNNTYPLTGAHAAITNCTQCHTNGYTNTPNTCAGCHQANFAQAANPNHTALNISNECAACHTTNPGWEPAAFPTHNNYYTLAGAHVPIANNCAACHNGNYTNTPNTCFGCHSSAYNQTTNPNHITSQFPASCETCHSQTAWVPSTFNHNNNYPLTGAHAAITNCTQCHTNGYTNTPNTCAGCHQANFAQAANPNHTALNISNECAACHTTNPGWEPAAFPIHNNYYTLAGAHVVIANNCATCHNGNYTNTPNTCFGCHSSAYNQTTNPNHITSQFPASCETCHSQSAWVPSTFNHNNTYPLTGAHASITNCTQCHTNGYTNTPNTCAGCHQANYNQSTNPNHVALNIPNTCANCHTTNPGWEPATFPTHNTYYVLAGAHAAIANQCEDCHNGNYINTPNTCAGCHITEYNQATNPNHIVAQFPTTCAECHTQNAWSPSTFNHDAQYFPIYSGKHKDEWNTCSDCHPNPSNYAVFTCTTSCHPQTSTNNEHQGEIGYQYLSSACLNCHPNGTGDGKSMDNSIFRNN